MFFRRSMRLSHCSDTQIRKTFHIFLHQTISRLVRVVSNFWIHLYFSLFFALFLLLLVLTHSLTHPPGPVFWTECRLLLMCLCDAATIVFFSSVARALHPMETSTGGAIYEAFNDDDERCLLPLAVWPVCHFLSLQAYNHPPCPPPRTLPGALLYYMSRNFSYGFRRLLLLLLSKNVLLFKYLKASEQWQWQYAICDKRWKDTIPSNKHSHAIMVHCTLYSCTTLCETYISCCRVKTCARAARK